ncbi:MAG: hypothetical protein U0Q47_00705 [Mycobacterium sp.]
MVKVSATAERYYLACAAAAAALAAQWNQGDPPVRAIVFQSSDPRLVGVAAEGHAVSAGRPTPISAPSSTRPSSSAIDLFGRLKASVRAQSDGEHLLDAG